MSHAVQENNIYMDTTNGASNSHERCLQRIVCVHVRIPSIYTGDNIGKYHSITTFG